MVDFRMKRVKEVNLQKGTKWFQEKEHKMGLLEEYSKVKFIFTKTLGKTITTHILNMFPNCHYKPLKYLIDLELLYPHK